MFVRTVKENQRVLGKMENTQNVDGVGMVLKSMKGWKKVIIPVQHMFPNCQVKYKTKCTDMKSCDKEVTGAVEVPSKEIPIEEIEIELILHNVNGYKIDPKRDKIPKKPEGFDGW